ncbi:Histidinol-phosphate aminotransferase, putative [Perkinsus marinus ATCC 50983]|uniref:histidinol-phosphate transaminase n=1 Tax=Perkinsus marinus (strain ATCC 50983 / TXsc) TaxID=423536 RepID=C5L8H8_PERM5|nr:Histidinol-phosphate aminotransferase, putative [Perkinsus marinus ATCC 50983]EER06967.1 Histidinol-phosphate aminotransferase, putative [Perkinsus marinus ATCC 50983]|eukprot:XP_002775151.1 Histidinol-phosphate aminotransferase, putative [Perkinsus marinus ATCC 50983]
MLIRSVGRFSPSRGVRPVAPLSHVKVYAPPDSLNQVLRDSKDLKNALKLDYNEATIPPPRAITDKLVSFLHSQDGRLTLPWYPHLFGEACLDGITEHVKLDKKHILVNNGSDDALRLIMDTFLAPGDKALVPQPSYPQVGIFIEGCHAQHVKMELKDPFCNDESELREKIAEVDPKVIYLISPNNPTDEAYHEFAKLPTSAHLVRELPNLVVTRTFSKCFGLAALRIGFLMAHEDTIKEMKKLYNTKSVNMLAQLAACEALKNRPFYMRYAAEVCNARDWLVKDLKSAGLEARAGGGNFLCVKMPPGVSPVEVVERMTKRDIFLRSDIHGRFPGFIRITAGTMEQMRRVAAELKAELGL